MKIINKSYAAGYFCVPSVSSLKKHKSPSYEAWMAMLNDMLKNNPEGRQIYDLYLSSRAIYASIGMSIVYCIGYIYLMSIFAEYIAWAMIGLTQLGLLGGAGYCLLAYKDRADPTSKLSDEVATKVLVGGIILGILAVIFAIGVCCGFNSLKTAIDVIDASADFLRKTKRIIFVPILYFILNILVVFFWITIVLCFNSMGEIHPETELIPQYRAVKFPKGHADDHWYIALALFFGLLWVIAFNRATSGFIVMVSATTYYFNSNAEEDGEANVRLGFTLAYMCHAGSLAIGAFIIALVQFIRIVFMTLAEQA